MTEEWRPVPGYEGLYEVSNEGRVRSLDRVVHHSSAGKMTLKGKGKALTKGHGGHPVVGLSVDNCKRNVEAHILVAAAFIGPRPEGKEVCHNDGNPENNHVSNLRYGTRSENLLDRIKHGVDFQSGKKECPYGHSYSGPNLRITIKKETGRECRYCKSCKYARSTISRRPDLKPYFKELADGRYMKYREENPDWL